MVTLIKLFQGFVANAKGVSLKKKLFKLTLCLLLVMGVISLYIVSYGFFVGSVEKTRCKNIGYFLYEPVEFLRVNSLLVYRITEEIYRLCGGTVDPLERKYFDTPRRFVENYPNGKQKMDVVVIAGGFRRKTWYPNGMMKEDYDETAWGRWNFSWEPSGKIKQQDGNFTLRYPSGKSVDVYVNIEYITEPYVENIICADIVNKKLIPLEDLKYLPTELRPFLLWREM